MRVLALDSTTRAGSVALVEDDRVVEERRGDAGRTHAERLPMELVALADAHHVALADVDLYAVASGPGSFTGLRIGIATAATLAPGTLIAVWTDAHRRDVFAAAYRVTAAAPYSAGRLEELDGP